MLVRSQDKKIVTENINFEIYPSDYKEEVYEITNSTVGLMGEYTSEEQALAVLDEICMFYLQDFDGVYQMPEDEEEVYERKRLFKV